MHKKKETYLTISLPHPKKSSTTQINILDIQKLRDHDKSHVFALRDAFLNQTTFKT